MIKQEKPSTKNMQKLTAKQERFCELYATKEDFFGNGVRAYAEAYGLDLSKRKSYGTAKVNASKLLTNANILARISILQEESGLNDVFVDKQLHFLVAQHVDLHVKLRAIQEYNRLKARHKLAVELNTRKTFDVNITNYQSYQEMVKNKDKLSEQELQRLVAEQVRFHKETYDMI